MFKYRDQLILTFSLKGTIFLKDVVDYDRSEANNIMRAFLKEKKLLYNIIIIHLFMSISSKTEWKNRKNVIIS